MQISPKRATSASDSSLSAKERSNSRRHSCSCPGLAQPSTTRSRPILRRLVVLAFKHYHGWVARGMSEAVDQGCEERARSEARAGVEFRCAGNPRMKVFMEGCQKPLKPKKYISFRACSAGDFSRGMR